MASSAATALQEATRDKLDARRLQQGPYFNAYWKFDEDEYLQYAKSLNSTARIFYLKRYIQSSQIPRLVTHIPYICTGGDSYIVTQDLKTYSGLEDCNPQQGDRLVSTEERRLSRNKCVASYVKIFANGGYKAPFRILDRDSYFDCIVVSGAGSQFEALYLDYADFIVEKTNDGRPSHSRLPAYAHHSTFPTTWADLEANSIKDETKLRKAMEEGASNEPVSQPFQFFLFSRKHALDVTAFMSSVRECIHLWLTAFDHLVATRVPDRRAGYFKLVAIGTGFFANVAHTGYNLGRVLLPILLRGAIDVLRSNAHLYAHIEAIEFPDFSADGSYSPPRNLTDVGGIRLVPAPRRDVLDFPKEVKERQLIPGVLNPGDCFAFVGNETSYGSVEAMIGCNSTLRINQNYLWNEWILDPAIIVGVQEPS